MDIIGIVDGIYNSLNGISVNGKSNLDLLLGSMMALEQLKVILEQKPKDGEESGRQTDRGLAKSDSDT